MKRVRKKPRKSRLYVDTEPGDAAVRILNIRQAYVRGMELEPGEYHVEVSSSGCRRDKRWIKLDAGRDENLYVSLECEPEPPSGPRETKQDGQFVAYDNGTVMDTKTGLMWAAKDNGEDINWHGAKKYCERSKSA
ncbi:MAG: DUF1566 domain-containing protein [bacterium]|nr:DUF1566 domain-containing protein [bacterium]